MKFYSALIKKDETGSVEDAVMLYDGFSWQAFIFGGLWFLYHKMWREFALILLLNLLIFHIPALSDFDKIMLEIAFNVIIAVNANYWLELRLQKKRGYKFSGMVGAANSVDAKLRLLQNSVI